MVANNGRNRIVYYCPESRRIIYYNEGQNSFIKYRVSFKTGSGDIQYDLYEIYRKPSHYAHTLIGK